MPLRFPRRFAAFAALPAILLAAPALMAEGGMGFDGDEFRTLTKAESAKVLDNFRRHRMPGDTRMRFVITHAARRSDDETRHVGELANRWDSDGPLTRIDLRPEGAPESATRRFLIRGGNRPGVWTTDAAGRPVRADAEALKPLQTGLVFTPYDLQLPFVHWTDAEYRETERFRTRPTDFFRMRPDEVFRTTHPEVGAVTLGFDRAYMALMRAETLGPKGESLRDLRAESFGKIDGRWIVRAMRLRDGVSRDTDTLTVKSAALNRREAASVFEPEGLSSPLPAAPESEYRKAD